MDSAALNSLPPLPQVPILRRMTAALWAREDVAALWLGGSFARREADAYSDLDLRVAVAPDHFPAWTDLDPAALLGEPVVGTQRMSWLGTAFYHVVLENGVIVDLLVQSADHTPPEDYTLPLACRDDAFGALLALAHLPPAEEALPDPETIRQAVIDFWIGSHKHAKVIGRGLDPVVLFGLGLEQAVLMRLWYVAATGRDLGTQRATIHTMTQTARAIEAGPDAHETLRVLGAPRLTSADRLRAVETSRDEVARVGRRLAGRLGFAYPEALEQTVRDSWLRFLADLP